MGLVLVLGLVVMLPGGGASEGAWDFEPGELAAPVPASQQEALPWQPAPTGAVRLSHDDCEPHPGIRVAEDEGSRGFVWNHPVSGAHEARPGSGVRSGSGTEEDPYVIEGWCIGAAGIEISNTRAHFVVRGNRVQGDGISMDAVGIRIENATHVTLQSNLVQASGHGIGVWSSAGVSIRDNLFTGNLRYGAWVAQSETVAILDNEARANENGLGIGLSHGALVAGNQAEQNTHSGILDAFSDDAQIRDNQLVGNEVGVYVREAFDVAVTDNDLEENRVNGLVFDLSLRGLAQGNTATGNGHEGVIFWSSPEGIALANEATRNGFADDRHGIRMAGSPGSEARDNMVGQNANGLVLDGSPASLVEGNLIRDNDGDGLILWDSPSVQASHNQLTGNGIGVQVVGDPAQLKINRNNIHANGFGLDATRADGIVDATANWWGCPRGPGHDDCDTLAGDADPSKWLRTPDRDAPGPDPGRGA